MLLLIMTSTTTDLWTRRLVLLAMTMTASCPALLSFVCWNQPDQPDHASHQRSRSTSPPSLSSIKGPSFPSPLQIFLLLFFFFPSLSQLILLHLLPLCPLPFSPSLSLLTNKNGSMVSDMHPTVHVPSSCQWMGCYGCLGGRQYHNAGSDTSWFSRASDSRFNTCFRDELERLPTTACLDSHE